jgi:quaternary ammonium compound-resistance protein SugE
LSLEHRKESSIIAWMRRADAGVSFSGSQRQNAIERSAEPDPARAALRQDRNEAGEVAVSAWLALLGAGLLEVGWALGLKYSDGLTRFWPTVATVFAITLSFALMALALRSLPFGTAYAVWTGIGAVGSIVLGMLLYSEPTDPVRIICLTLIIVGMVGLKLNSPV